MDSSKAFGAQRQERSGVAQDPTSADLCVGMVGLGRMGANMVERLLESGIACVVHDASPHAAAPLVERGAVHAPSLAALVERLPRPRTVWMMVPAGVVDTLVEAFGTLLSPGDILVDGGNSPFHEAPRRAERLRASAGATFVDVGTSGGVWGKARGYCLMVGGDAQAVRVLTPVFQALAPGVDAAPRSASRAQGPLAAEETGWLHCGPSGAGHFVKMVHNGIEYGLMAALAEGFALLEKAGAGRAERKVDAETTPLQHPERYRYDFDVAAIAELWRRGSVVSSWLLDLAANALHQSPTLHDLQGRVSDSGEGRWTLDAAVALGVPTPVLASALFQRFQSRGEGDFANRVLSALRREFGGHGEASGPHVEARGSRAAAPNGGAS